MAGRREDDNSDTVVVDTGFPVPTKITAQVLLPPTVEEKRAAQTRLLIGELTQAALALGVSAATIVGAFRGIESTILSSAFVLIIGLYFVPRGMRKLSKDGD